MRTTAEQTGQRILDEARRLFAEKGFDAATTAEIARRANVAEGSIYRHFQDKQELFIACLEFDVAGAMTAAQGDLQRARNLHELMRRLLQIRLDLMRENLQSFNILITEAPHHPELTEMFIRRILGQQLENVAPIAQRMIQSGELRRPPNLTIMGLGLTVAIWAILLFGQQFQATLQAQFPLVGATQGDLLDELTDFVLYGIAGPQPGGEK